MATFQVTHEGQKYRIEADDEATALEAFQSSISAEPQVAAAPKMQGSIPAAIRGAVDTATFGFADEIAAGLGAATGIHGEFGEYQKNLARQRGVAKFDEENNPGARLTGQVVGGVGSGVGLLKAGLSAIPRVANAGRAARYGTAAGEGATLSGVYGFGSGEDGFQNRALEAAKSMPVGAAGGVVGEVLAPFVSKGVNAVTSRVGAGAIDPTAARAQLAQSLGVDPATIPDEVAADFAKRAAQAVDPANAAREAAAGEFGIPLTRGQATQDMASLGFEEAARNQARGQLAGNTVRNFDERQQAAIANARTGIAEQVDQGRPVTTTSQNEMSQDILDGLKQRERHAWQDVDFAYEAARDAGTALRTDAVQGAGTAVRRGLEESSFVLNETSTPYAMRALQEVDNMVNLKGALANRTATGPVEPGAEVAGVSLAGVEKVRSKLLALERNAPFTEKGAVVGVRKSFDKWLDDAADTGLLEGTPEGIELFKAARKARRDYASKFESNPRQADDDAGRLIEKMIEKDATPVELANGLFGSAKAGERGVSVRTAARLKEIFEPDSPEWGSVKQAAWFKVTGVNADGAATLGPEAVSKRILEFAAGKGEPFAQVLYSPAEIAQMRRFAVALQQTVTPRNVRNPSGSGYEAARALGDGIKSVASLVGGVSAGPIGAMGARLGAGLFGEGKNFVKARGAVAGAPRLPYDSTSRAAVSGGAYGLVADQKIQ